MEILIIGGTRNAGHFLTLELLQNGHTVTIFNRGKAPDELPGNVRRLHGDRSDPASLAAALAGKSFDAAIDMALYNETDAKAIAGLLDGRVGHYLFLSTGQVYLVRTESPRPFPEEAFDKPILPAPVQGTRDYEEWLYGIQKSEAEAVLIRARETRGFPFTTLRLPMVNSERDHFHRVHGYVLRLQDGGPILIPAGKHLSLRHVYVGDVIQAIVNVIETGSGNGRAFNISQEETLSIEEFLTILAGIVGGKAQLVGVPVALLESSGLLPDCSPFSDPWMSELDNRRSKLELGMQYTPASAYLQKLVAFFTNHQFPVPEGYRRRSEEIQLASQM